jgi:hypothetical protein
MMRFWVLTAMTIGWLAIAPDLAAFDVLLPPATSATPDSIEAAHLMAAEIAARAQGGGFSNGRFTPTVPRPAAVIGPAAQPAAPAAAPATCGAVKGLVADATTADGMHFMPLHRDMSQTFKMPARSEAMARAEAVKAAIAGGKSESALAQAALQADAQASAATQARTELANYTGQAPPPVDPQALAKEAVLREIQKYRASGGKF